MEFEECNWQPCPIDGKPGNWGPWGPCSKQCDPGEMVRRRSCEVMPKYNGRPCDPYTLKHTIPCILKRCPVNGKYSDWKPYGACSTTCGPGKKERTRECNNPAPAHEGKACEGPSKETAECNEKPCPVNGKYSDWKPYGACSTTCGPGKKERIRECNNPAPAHGGKACEGLAKETADCNEKPCPVKGKYSDWKPYGACSTTCGPGKKERIRECNNPAPAHGGKECEGPAKETADCNAKPCPVPNEEKTTEPKKDQKKLETKKD